MCCVHSVTVICMHVVYGAYTIGLMIRRQMVLCLFYLEQTHDLRFKKMP